MADVIFTGTITRAGGATDLLNPAVSLLFEEDKVSAMYDTTLLSKLGFDKQYPLNPNEVRSGIMGAQELTEITEGALIPDSPRGKNPDKGFKEQEFTNKFPITRTMYEFMMSSQSIQKADSSVQSELKKLATGIDNFRNAAIKTANIEGTALFTLGWSSANANGPGSATPKGLTLFNAAHTYGYPGGTGTFGNILGAGSYGTADDQITNDTNGDAAIQASLDILKDQVKLSNGDFVMTPSKYILMVPTQLATTVRKRLNTPGNQVGMYSGATDNTNANVLNQFSFNGNTVEILENRFINFTSSNRGTLGSGAYWFMINAEAAKFAKSLVYRDLISPEFDVWEDKTTKKRFVSVYTAFAVDHYGAESFMVGSRGTA